MSPSTGNDKSDSHVELGDRQDELEVVPGPVLTLDLDLDVPTVDQTELDAAETEEDYIYILSVFWHFLVRFRSHSDPDAAVVARVKTHVEYVFTVWKQRHAESFHWWHKKMKLKFKLIEIMEI